MHTYPSEDNNHGMSVFCCKYIYTPQLPIYFLLPSALHLGCATYHLLQEWLISTCDDGVCIWGMNITQESWTSRRFEWIDKTLSCFLLGKEWAGLLWHDCLIGWVSIFYFPPGGVSRGRRIYIDDKQCWTLLYSCLLSVCLLFVL